MGKKKVVKKRHSSGGTFVTPSPKKTAYGVFQEKLGIGPKMEPMSSAKKRKFERASTKRVREAVKFETRGAEKRTENPPKCTNRYAQNFFKMLNRKTGSIPLESVSIVSGKQPISSPMKKSDITITTGDDEKRDRKRGKRKGPVKNRLGVFDGRTDVGVTVADSVNKKNTSSKISVPEACYNGDAEESLSANKECVMTTSPNPTRSSARLRKNSLKLKDGGGVEVVDSREFDQKIVTERKRKSSDSGLAETTMSLTKDGSGLVKQTRSKRRTRRKKRLNIVGHGSMGLAQFVAAAADSVDEKSASNVEESEVSVLETTLEDSVVETTEENETSMDMVEDSWATITSDHIIPVPDEDRVYIVLDHPQEISLCGKYSIRTLIGGVSIHGYNLNQGMPSQEVFSPEHSSHLVIKTLPTLNSEEMKEILESEIKWKGTLENVQGVIYESSSLIELVKLDCSVCDKVRMVNPFHSLFPNNGSIGGLSFQDQKLSNVGVSVAGEGTKTCFISPEYEEIVEAFTDMIRSKTDSAPVAVLCGGKNVGKSTLGRYLINSALNSCDSVGYLECDVGQTEFTPPGCVAFNIISKPLLGPPFTHQRKPECMYYIGASSPADDPSFYIDCVKKVFNVYHSMEPKIPLIVNTMGWTQGMGVSLLMDTIRTVSPDFIVQLQSSNYYRNYSPLTTEYVSQTPGWKYRDMKNRGGTGKIDFRHFTISSPTNLAQDGQDKYRAADHRDLAILAYLSHVLPPSVSLLNIHSVPPYKLKWSSVAVHVANAVVPHAQIMYALNATIVALCHADTSLMIQPQDNTLPKTFHKTPICDCIGFGLIRGIDPVEKIFYILTPVAISELHLVNTIIKGAITIPNQLLIKPKSTDIVPYVDNPQNVQGVKPVARKFLTRRKSPHRGKKD